MEIIVDKGFLTSFFQHNSSDRHKHLFDDFIRFIRKLHPGFSLVTNFSSQEELDAHTLENPLLEIIIEKAGPPVFLEEFNQRLREKAFYEQHSCLKMFLVDCSTKDCNTLEGAYGYSFICGENFNWKWQPFYSDRDDSTRYITSNTALPENLRFDSWSSLAKYKHPLNAVLIVDNYILSDKSNQPVEYNLKPLLLSLLPKNKTEIPVDITIITEQDPKNGSIKEAVKNLEEYLKSGIPDLDFNLNIIKYDRNILYRLDNEGFSIHNRRIITNYFWMESGVGFNIMNHKGKVNDSDSDISFKFNLLGQNYNGLKYLLKGYAAYAEIAKDKFTFGSEKVNRLLTEF